MGLFSDHFCQFLVDYLVLKLVADELWRMVDTNVAIATIIVTAIVIIWQILFDSNWTDLLILVIINFNIIFFFDCI